MTGRPLVNDLEDAFVLIFFNPAVHHSFSVELELLELLEVTDVLTEGAPDVLSRAFLSLLCPTLSPTCHDKSAANMVTSSQRPCTGTVTKLDSTCSEGE